MGVYPDTEGFLSIRYHLHKQFTYIDSSNVVQAQLCTSCLKDLKSNKIPKFSLAAGHDYGDIKRHPNYLTDYGELSLAEMQCIRKVQAYCVVVSVTNKTYTNKRRKINGLRKELVGHVICMPSSASETITSTVLPLPISSMDPYLKVVFVGNVQNFNEARNGLLTSNFGIINLPKVRRYLELICALNPDYSDVRISQPDIDVDNIVNIGSKVHHISDEVLVHLNTNMVAVNDIANVRNNDANEINDLNNEIINDINLTNEHTNVLNENINSSQQMNNSNVNNVTEIDLNYVVVAREDGNIGPVTVTELRTRTINDIYNCCSSNLNNSHLSHLPSATSSIPVPINPSLNPNPPLIIPVRNGDNIPLNDYTDNAKIYSQVFPYIFLNGTDGFPDGPPHRDLHYHWSRQFDLKFGDKTLLFKGFNTAQRSAAAKAVSTKVRNDPSTVKRFQSMVNENEFIVNIGKAQNNVLGPEATKILKEFSPLLRTTGGTVPFGSGERAFIASKLYALQIHLGPPSWFITFAPDDVNHLLICRLSYPSTKNTGFPFSNFFSSPSDLDINEQINVSNNNYSNNNNNNDNYDFNNSLQSNRQLPEEFQFEIPINKTARENLVANNPIAVGIIFQDMVKILFEIMFGLEVVNDSLNSKKKQKLDMMILLKVMIGKMYFRKILL